MPALLGPGRLAVSRVVGLGGLAAYNWWVWVVVGTGLLTSPNVLFSDLEVVGHAHAALLSHLDVIAGLLIGVALLLRGQPSTSGERMVWGLLLGFAAAGVVGGLFPYVCSEASSTACRSAEWHFQLPLRHYVHVGAGIIEFLCASGAVLVAGRRRADASARVARAVRGVAWVLAVAYPLLAVAYLTDRLGAVIEPLFFLSFSAIVTLQLFAPAPAFTPAVGAESVP